MKKIFKSIEEIWAYAKQIMPNGVVVSKIANTGSSKFFNIVVPSVLVQDSKLKKYQKIETVISLISGDTISDAFCEQTNKEYSIVDSNDFKEAFYYCAAMLVEGMNTRKLSIYEAVSSISAPITVGDDIRLVTADGDVTTDIVTGVVDDIKPVKEVLPQIKADNQELYKTIMNKGYSDTDKAYYIKGGWYIDDPNNNIYALLRESKSDCFGSLAIVVNGKSYFDLNSIDKDIKQLKDVLKNSKYDKVNGKKAYVNASAKYNELKSIWNQIFAGSSKGNIITEEVKQNIKAISIITNIENSKKNIPTDKFKSMINSVSDFQKKLLSDPDTDIKAIVSAEHSLDWLKKELKKRGIKDGTSIK